MKKTFYSLLVLISMNACAKSVRVKSADALRKKLASSEYSIVLFYDGGRENIRNKITKQKIEDMEVMFSSLSEDSHYQDARLQFIRADISHKKLSESRALFKLLRTPAFVIFLGRKPDAKLYGYVYRDTVEAFINQHLKQRMDHVIKLLNEQRKKKLEETKIRAYNRPYIYGPYWYGGFYPYWSYGFGWPRYYGARYW